MLYTSRWVCDNLALGHAGFAASHWVRGMQVRYLGRGEVTMEDLAALEQLEQRLDHHIRSGAFPGLNPCCLSRTLSRTLCSRSKVMAHSRCMLAPFWFLSVGPVVIQVERSCGCVAGVPRMASHSTDKLCAPGADSLTVSQLLLHSLHSLVLHSPHSLVSVVSHSISCM